MKTRFSLLKETHTDTDFRGGYKKNEVIIKFLLPEGLHLKMDGIKILNLDFSDPTPMKIEIINKARFHDYIFKETASMIITEEPSLIIKSTDFDMKDDYIPKDVIQKEDDIITLNISNTIKESTRRGIKTTLDTSRFFFRARRALFDELENNDYFGGSQRKTYNGTYLRLVKWNY